MVQTGNIKDLTCEAPLPLAHRAPDRAAGPTGRTNARAVDERASSIVAVGAPVIMIRFVSGEVQVKPRVLLRWGARDEMT